MHNFAVLSNLTAKVVWVIPVSECWGTSSRQFIVPLEIDEMLTELLGTLWGVYFEQRNYVLLEQSPQETIHLSANNLPVKTTLVGKLMCQFIQIDVKLESADDLECIPKMKDTLGSRDCIEVLQTS